MTRFAELNPIAYEERLTAMTARAESIIAGAVSARKDDAACIIQLIEEVQRLRKKLKAERRQVKKGKRRLKNRASALEARLAQEGGDEA